jgi:hypothetical protein
LAASNSCFSAKIEIQPLITRIETDREAIAAATWLRRLAETNLSVRAIVFNRTEIEEVLHNAEKRFSAKID